MSFCPTPVIAEAESALCSGSYTLTPTTLARAPFLAHMHAHTLLHIHAMFPWLLATETNSGTCSRETGRMRMRTRQRTWKNLPESQKLDSQVSERTQSSQVRRKEAGTSKRYLPSSPSRTYQPTTTLLFLLLNYSLHKTDCIHSKYM